MSAAGLERLDEIGGAGVSPDVLERLRRRSQERRDAAWERLGGVDETPSQAYARLRTQMIDAERTKLLRIRDEGLVASEVLAEALGAIDVEETVLQLGEMLNLAERDEDLVPRQTLRTCSHLGAAATTVRPGTPGGCKECLEEGLEWVHLRICLSCGHVGCCDSSIGKHANGHYTKTTHPVMRSFEVGEAWRWCYVDGLVG